mmetsp:Transcript_9185/g.13782  ORF Transcript_9185/g.13782 Transcript_9185/m.13782 type:complete len:151 (+) Transcript_9185:162-614(+)
MAQSLWDAAADLIKVTETHPFLVAMVDGTLSEDSFRYYAVQDALYLVDFKSCLVRLADKMNVEMSNDDSTKEASIQRVKGLAIAIEESEVELHRSFFKQWNIDASDATSMPDTLLYCEGCFDASLCGRFGSVTPMFLGVCTCRKMYAPTT